MSGPEAQRVPLCGNCHSNFTACEKLTLAKIPAQDWLEHTDFRLSFGSNTDVKFKQVDRFAIARFQVRRDLC